MYKPKRNVSTQVEVKTTDALLSMQHLCQLFKAHFYFFLWVKEGSVCQGAHKQTLASLKSYSFTNGLHALRNAFWVANKGSGAAQIGRNGWKCLEDRRGVVRKVSIDFWSEDDQSQLIVASR